MKYNFKPELVYRDIDHHVMRFLNEYAPGHKLIVPVTTDPCSIVGAWTIWKICPNSFEAIYMKERDTHTDVMDDAVQLLSENLDEHFIVFDMSRDYPSFGKFYGELLGKDPITTMRLQYDARSTFLLSKFRDMDPLIVSSMDFVRSCIGLNANTYSLSIFNGLYFFEIMKIGEYLGVDKDLILKLMTESDEFLRFNKEVKGIDANMLYYFEDFRDPVNNIEPTDKAKEALKGVNALLEKYMPPVKKYLTRFNSLIKSDKTPIVIQNHSLYDMEDFTKKGDN